jgi:hypothetical protein
MCKRNFTVTRHLFSNNYFCLSNSNHHLSKLRVNFLLSSFNLNSIFYSTMFHRIVAALAASTCVESQITVLNDVDQCTQFCNDIIDKFCIPTLSQNARRQCRSVYGFTCQDECLRQPITVESKMPDHIGDQCTLSCFEKLTKCLSGDKLSSPERGRCFNNFFSNGCLDKCHRQSQITVQSQIIVESQITVES